MCPTVHTSDNQGHRERECTMMFCCYGGDVNMEMWIKYKVVFWGIWQSSYTNTLAQTYEN